MYSPFSLSVCLPLRQCFCFCLGAPLKFLVKGLWDGFVVSVCQSKQKSEQSLICLITCSTLNIEPLRSSETSVYVYQTIWHHIAVFSSEMSVNLWQITRFTSQNIVPFLFFLLFTVLYACTLQGWFSFYIVRDSILNFVTDIENKKE
jgi:hypothetical protein